MSTHAIAWFDEEDLLGLDTPAVATAEARCERRYERVKIDVRVRVSYVFHGETQSIDGQGNDVSGGGMALYIPADLNIGDNVVVEVIQRYGRPRVTFSATVNNRNGFRYGMEFVGVEDDHRATLVQNITGATITN